MPPCSHFSTPHGSRAVFRCLHIPGLRCFHQGGSGATNGCGRGEEPRKTREAKEPRNTRNTRKNSEPRMDTNGHEKTQEPRMAMGRGEEPRKTREAEEPRNTRNTRKKLRNHEWTRMDTNGRGQGRGGSPPCGVRAPWISRRSWKNLTGRESRTRNQPALKIFAKL